jgi:bifunctional DNA-binding transcriptional regulator/antitoxin component of YhaV-PrlF toxin-antitoxin module
MPTNAETSFTTIFHENEHGDIFLEFPEEVMELVGWSEGDTIEIDVVADTIRIRKIATGAAEDC